jgi:hypothetical protein
MSAERGKKSTRAPGSSGDTRVAASLGGIDAQVAMTWKQLNDIVELSIQPRHDAIPQGGGQVRIKPRRMGGGR